MNLHQLQAALPVVRGPQKGDSRSTEPATAIGLLSLTDNGLLDILKCFEKFDNQNLAALSLTCRRLCAVVTPQLYKAVQLTKQNALLLERTVKGKPEYIQHIKSVQLWWDRTTEALVPVASEVDEVACRQADRVLSRCSALEKFELVDQGEPIYLNKNLFSSLSKMNKLTTIEGPAFTAFLKLLPLGMRNKNLILNESHMTKLASVYINVEGNYHEKFPLLRAIHLGGSVSSSLAWSFLWMSFSTLTSLNFDKMDQSTMIMLLNSGNGQFRKYKVIVDNPTYLRNLCIEMDQSHGGRFNNNPPSLILPFELVSS